MDYNDGTKTHHEFPEVLAIAKVILAPAPQLLELRIFVVQANAFISPNRPSNKYSKEFVYF